MEISATGAKNSTESLKLRYKAPELIIIIDKLYRQISWIVGQTAYRMIKVYKHSNDSNSE